MVYWTIFSPTFFIFVWILCLNKVFYKTRDQHCHGGALVYCVVVNSCACILILDYAPSSQGKVRLYLFFNHIKFVKYVINKP